jgi:hypothetical protein
LISPFNEIPSAIEAGSSITIGTSCSTVDILETGQEQVNNTISLKLDAITTQYPQAKPKKAQKNNNKHC